jgi:AcrR family transcriptional regulator
MPRYKKAERDQALSQTRRALLDAAADEFAREGYAGANVNRISKAAGFAIGTIYNHFESKRALMLALIDQVSEAHLRFIAEPLLEEQAAGRRLERFFEAGFSFVAAYPPQGQAMVNNLYGPDTEFKQAMYQAYLPMFELVGRDIIALGMSQGVFRPVDPATTANLVMNIYLGVASQVNQQGEPWHDPAQVAEFVLRALRK